MVKQPFYHSTRGNEEKAPKEAILQGIAKDGGLFVWDGLDEVKIVLEDFLKLEYKDMVKVLFKELLWDEIPDLADRIRSGVRASIPVWSGSPSMRRH